MSSHHFVYDCLETGPYYMIRYGGRAGVHTGFCTITLVLYIGSLPNLVNWFPCGRARTLYMLGSLGQRSMSLTINRLFDNRIVSHDNFSSVYWIFTKLGHMIPLWKGKNLIYVGVIRSKVKVTVTLNIIFDNGRFHITLVLYIGSLTNLSTWFPCGRGRTLSTLE